VNEPVLLVDVTDRIALLTLNRPDSRNALNGALSNALWDAVLAAGANDAVDVVVITGSDPAFCAGVDLKEVSGEVAASEQVTVTRRGPDGLYRFLPVIDKPVIGAVNGACITGGLELALQCTFLVASDRARFADTHGRAGILPGGGMTVLLPQAIGLRRAIEMSLTGNFVPAEEALRLGLVNHVVPHDELLPFAIELATAMAEQDRTMVSAMRQDWDATDRLPLAAAHAEHNRFAQEQGLRDGTSADLASHREGVIRRAHEQLTN
jgi:enoyl-CoA hydratase